MPSAHIMCAVNVPWPCCGGLVEYAMNLIIPFRMFTGRYSHFGIVSICLECEQIEWFCRLYQLLWIGISSLESSHLNFIMTAAEKMGECNHNAENLASLLISLDTRLIHSQYWLTLRRILFCFFEWVQFKSTVATNLFIGFLSRSMQTNTKLPTRMETRIPFMRINWNECRIENV